MVFSSQDVAPGSGAVPVVRPACDRRARQGRASTRMRYASRTSGPAGSPHATPRPRPTGSTSTACRRDRGRHPRAQDGVRGAREPHPGEEGDRPGRSPARLAAGRRAGCARRARVGVRRRQLTSFDEPRRASSTADSNSDLPDVSRRGARRTPRSHSQHRALPAATISAASSSGRHAGHLPAGADPLPEFVLHHRDRVPEVLCHQAPLRPRLDPCSPCAPGAARPCGCPRPPGANAEEVQRFSWWPAKPLQGDQPWEPRLTEAEQLLLDVEGDRPLGADVPLRRTISPASTKVMMALESNSTELERRGDIHQSGSGRPPRSRAPATSCSASLAGHRRAPKGDRGR